ncbi:MAG: hypothetical protein IPL46_22400 [Saprospiraceae bacterium]|nr:hypothetical protein [Saprospiraceae bacterium]
MKIISENCSGVIGILVLSTFLSISFLPPILAQPTVGSDSSNLQMERAKDIVLELVYDDQNQPQYYSSEIFTQVCETGECKPVRIRLNWDLLGNYLNYAMPKGSILTKMDHIPFNATDYQKFASILNDRYSVLEDFNLSQLKGPKEKATVQEIDGITGATPKSIENAIVPGAVYTCYTIWHLAHVSIKDTILEKSQLLRNEEILYHFIDHENSDYQRWAIDNIFQFFRHSQQLVDQVLHLFQSDKVFLKKHILQQIPDSLLAQRSIQNLLWPQYPGLSYSLQLILLRRYSDIPVDQEVKDLLESYRSQSNQEQLSLFQLIRTSH